MARKIIQIATTAVPGVVEGEDVLHHRFERVVALCDDGSLWFIGLTEGDDASKQWEMLRPIPTEGDNDDG